MFLLDLEPLNALFCSKGLEYHAIFPEKMLLSNII
jgi:hypothetical protein